MHPSRTAMDSPQWIRARRVPGEAFGCEGFLRLSYALSVPRIEEGILRLRTFAGAG